MKSRILLPGAGILATVCLGGCGHMGSAGYLMDTPEGPALACEGPLGAWWNEGLEVEASPPLYGGGPPLLGSVLGLAEQDPEAGLADVLTLELTPAGLVVTSIDAGTPTGLVVIPATSVRCAHGRVEVDRREWQTEAAAGTALRESGTLTLSAGSSGSLVVEYDSTRYGVVLYGIPVWMGDDGLYRFTAVTDEAPARPASAAPEGSPPDDLAAIALHGLPGVRVRAIDGVPIEQNFWKLIRANSVLVTPGLHHVEVEVIGEVPFWSLMAPPEVPITLPMELEGGHTYVVFGGVPGEGAAWAEVVDAGREFPVHCLPEPGVPPTTHDCLASRDIPWPSSAPEAARQ